jgi:hypothetical protein
MLLNAAMRLSDPTVARMATATSVTTTAASALMSTSIADTGAAAGRARR